MDEDVRCHCLYLLNVQIYTVIKKHMSVDGEWLMEICDA